jgi:immune inhibitor A
MKNKPSFLLIALLIISFFVATEVFAMPPHPTLLEKIQKGEIAEPDFFKNSGQLRQKGIDASWTAPKLSLKRLSESPKTATRSFGPLLVPSGSWKALIILVDFSDNDSQVAASFFDDLIFGTGTFTLRDYYWEVSYHNLDIVTVDPPSSLGWKRVPQNYAYYVDGQHGLGNYPKNAQKMVEDAVELVDPFVDFSLYDNDGDGNVDALFVVHAGSGAELTGSPDDIWSHQWEIIPQRRDGVYISIYSTEPEYWLTPGDMTMGVYAHELSHAAFGLPDLYDTNYNSEGLGNWSLMAGGSWNGSSYPGGDSPALPDVWSRFQMGYVTPVNVISKLTGQTIKNIETDSEAYRLWSNGSTGGNQYFLVENRQQTGYDTYLPGNGLLIYHIDESVHGNNNQWYPDHTSFGHYEVALEQADGLWELEKNSSSGNDGDPYPGSTTNRNFTFLTLPGSRDYNDNSTYVKIKNISNSASTMTADVSVLPEYTITALAGADGTISPLGTIGVDDGDTPTFTITSDSGYHLASLLLDGTPVDTENGILVSYIFEPVIADHTIEATFEANPSSGGGGGGGGGGAVGPVAVGISAILGWWKRRVNPRKGKL